MGEVAKVNDFEERKRELRVKHTRHYLEEVARQTRRDLAILSSPVGINGAMSRLSLYLGALATKDALSWAKWPKVPR